MAIHLPHIEDSNQTNYIQPKGEFQHFLDEAHYAEKAREWGLIGTKEVKKEFWYKNKTHQRLVTIKGYESYGITGEYNTLVIEFQDGNLSCISPALLKEMQSPSFGKESIVPATDNLFTQEATVAAQNKNQEKHQDSPENVRVSTKDATIAASETVPEKAAAPKKAKSAKAKKEKTPKLNLPVEKVHFTGKVKQFALSWNHFNEDNDEVVVLENVRIESEEAPLEVGLAWCSHSKTLKKFELNLGEELEFDGKIVKKSLPKGKDVEDETLRLEISVPYKINNPSKIKKI